jgi:electron transfer flavoprotein alpha subunit
MANRDIWIITRHREGNFEPETFGLIAEARRLVLESKSGSVTAVVLGTGISTAFGSLKNYGADAILYAESDLLNHYNGELFTLTLAGLANKYKPGYIFMAQNPESADLGPRLAATMEISIVTRAMDFVIDDNGKASAVRPVANGYLFERLEVKSGNCIVCFLPSMLIAQEPDPEHKAKIIQDIPDIKSFNLKTILKGIIEAAPEDLNIEEADIVVSAGRGVRLTEQGARLASQGAGKDESFNIIHELARAIGGSVGATRPVIDWQLLPFERQIGQTGKTVAPRLLFACGISGANEYTAGIEKSQFVIAINNDARARIFRFADLGIVGDLHKVLPLLIEQIKREVQG